MKKLFLIAILAFTMFGQLKFTEFKFGSLNPKDAKAGIYGSITAGSMFDANLGYAFELGLYSKTYTKTSNTYIQTENGFTTTGIATSFETSTTMLPLFLKFNYVKELGTTLLFKSDFGIGYAFLWNSYDDYENGTDGSNSFNGFQWQVGADIGLQISSKGSVYAGLYYNGGTVSSKDKEARLPTINEVDMSGLGIRFSIRIDGLGIL